MCDILAITSKATSNGTTIFAKNSDRDINEAQIIEFIPPQKKEKRIKITYVDIDLDVIDNIRKKERTLAIIHSRPWWIWGSEMGINEKGVAIGNTALFTKRVNKKPGVLGMDIVRIALQFSETADEALEIITEIIQKFGQGGSGSYEKKFFYNNSFIVVSPEKSIKIETIYKNYFAKKIDVIETESNFLTLAEKSESDILYTYLSKGKERWEFTNKALQKMVGKINLKYIMKILSSTYSKDGNLTHHPPQKGSTRDVCMHYGGILRPSQTASSQISEIYNNLSVNWFTGTSLPCLSIFKPFYLKYDEYTNYYYNNHYEYNKTKYWWRVERFHRLFALNYDKFIGDFSEEKEKIQEEIISLERETREEILKGIKPSNEITKIAYEKEEKLISKWEEIVEKEKSKTKLNLYNLFLILKSRKVGLKI